MFLILSLYAMFSLFDLLDDIQKSPKWVDGYWEKYKK
jgi:hypothetical protein